MVRKKHFAALSPKESFSQGRYVCKMKQILSVLACWGAMFVVLANIRFSTKHTPSNAVHHAKLEFVALLPASFPAEHQHMHKYGSDTKRKRKNKEKKRKKKKKHSNNNNNNNNGASEFKAIDSYLPKTTFSESQDHICKMPPVEAEVPFPFAADDGNTCDDKLTTKATGAVEILPSERNSLAKKASCAFCGQNKFVAFLQTVSDALWNTRGAECKNLITYGVAFGSRFEQILAQSAWKIEKSNCFFVFTLAKKSSVITHDTSINEWEKYFNSNKTSQLGHLTLIPIPSDVLPYTNNRRNTKLLKLYGGLKIFSFTERILWQDAKLSKKGWAKQNYTAYFEKNIDETQVCVAFKTLPKHAVTYGDRKPSFMNHCQTLLDVTHRVVSDNLQVIQRQCQFYNSTVRQDDDFSLDGGMIDSAFIAYDMRSSKCRAFNERMACEWLSEIHCQSDRDQLSFPQVLRTMDLSETTKGGDVDTTATDRILVSKKTEESMIHLGKGRCHWYVKKQHFTQCRSNAIFPNIKYIAVVVAGGLLRYNLESTVSNLLHPMVMQGHDVDYYLSITSELAPAYRSNVGYMSHLTFDPVLGKDAEKNLKQTRRFITEAIAESGALAKSILVRQTTSAAKNKRWMKKRKFARKKYPNEDQDLRFPLLDMRESARNRTANANRNILTLFHGLGELWGSLVGYEEKWGVAYDYVLFLRDDAMFLESFDLDSLLKLGQPDTDAFVLSCDARALALHPLEINDYGGLYRREKADVYGNYFWNLFKHRDCADQLDSNFRKKGTRGCNSEMILKWILKKHDVNVQRVSQKALPFQRAVHVQRGDGKIEPCFHKYCQSIDAPLGDAGVQQCTAVDFTEPFSPAKVGCAINFFGLPRAFKSMVLPSIVRNVLKPNARHNCHIFVHFYDQKAEAGGRRNEGGSINADDIYLLEDAVKQVHRNLTVDQSTYPTVVFTNDTEQEFWKERGELLAKFHNTLDIDGQPLYFPYKKDSYLNSSVDNIVKQWHSVQSVFELMERVGKEKGVRYSRVGMFRSDVVYLTPIDITLLDKGKEDNKNKRVVTPGFAKWPVNDRMVYGPYEAVKIWSTKRFELVEERARLRKAPGLTMHSEHFMNDELIPAMTAAGFQHRINEDICFARVRANGSVKINDCDDRKGGTTRGWRTVDKKALIESITGNSNCKMEGEKRSQIVVCDGDKATTAIK